MIELWGVKTHALFDAWSIEHVISGITVGSLIVKKNNRIFQNIILGFRTRLYWDVAAVLLIAYFWETIEHYLETGSAGEGVAYWFQGVEFWANRIITDPLAMVIGYLFFLKCPWLAWPARIFGLIWLALHIFIFPHSMYLHELV